MRGMGVGENSKTDDKEQLINTGSLGRSSARDWIIKGNWRE